MSQPNVSISKNNLTYIEVLRVSSMLAVVFLHAVALALRADIGTPVWHLFNTATSLLTTSVPLFFMISGALLLGSQQTESITYTLKKRILKLLFPLLTWSIIALLRAGLYDASISGNFSWSTFIEGLKKIPSGPVAVHFWFMYILIPLYLISPLLKKLSNGLSDTHLAYLLILWLSISLLNSVKALMPIGLQPLLSVSMLTNLHMVGGYVGYFFLGHALNQMKKRMPNRILVAIIVLMTALIALGSWWKSTETHAYNEQFKSYISIYAIVLASAIFLFVKQLYENRADSCKKVPPFLAFLSSLSFGVYLMHNVFIAWLYTTGWPTIGFYACMASFLLATVVSGVVIILLSSIKPICALMTGLSWEKACKSCNLVYFLKK